MDFRGIARNDVAEPESRDARDNWGVTRLASETVADQCNIQRILGVFAHHCSALNLRASFHSHEALCSTVQARLRKRNQNAGKLFAVNNFRPARSKRHIWK